MVTTSLITQPMRDMELAHKGFFQIVDYFWHKQGFQDYSMHSYPHFDFNNVPFHFITYPAYHSSWYIRVLQYLRDNRGGVICLSIEKKTIIEFMRKNGFDCMFEEFIYEPNQHTKWVMFLVSPNPPPTYMERI